MRVVVLLPLLYGCGRVGFEARDDGLRLDGDQATVDATFAPQGFTYVKASNAETGDFFGTIAIAADGSTVVVGATGEDSDANSIDGNQNSNAFAASGAAYIFVQSGSTWIQQAYLKASNADIGDAFGRSVAVSGDGNTVAVSANWEDSLSGNPTDNSGQNVGAVYVFVRTGVTWTQQAYLKAANAEDLDEFGSNIAISADGNTLAVTALTEDSASAIAPGDNSRPQSGAAYIFTRTGITWSQQQYLKASNPDTSDLFGARIALSGDGNTVIVGATQESSDAAGVDGDQTNNNRGNSGAAYVFARSGGIWMQQAYLKASNPYTNAEFGTGLSLSTTGDTLVVGAYGESSTSSGINGDQANGTAFQSGAVYVFERTGANWAQSTFVKATNAEAFDFFGYEASLSGDGQFLAVGAFEESSSATGIGGEPTNNDRPSSGAVYVYARSGATWIPRAYIKSPTPSANDQLGVNLAFSADASVLAIGAQLEDGSGTGIDVLPDEEASDSGALYLLR